MTGFKNKTYLLLALILFLGFVFRLYRIDSPIADWHSWRQSDTSAVSQFLVKNNFDLLHPQYYDISNVQSGLDNPSGYRMVEFPLYNLFQAGGSVLFPQLSLEHWGRLVTILFSLSTSLFLYLIVQKFSDKKSALMTAFFYTFLPFSIYYGRSILPDTAMIASVMGGIYFFSKYLEDKKIFLFFFLTLIFFTASLLFKPYAIFFTLPVLYLALHKYGLGLLKRIDLYVLGIFSVAPLIMWRFWIAQFPEGIPVSGWLFNAENIRFSGAFFYWIFGKRIGELILGFFGVALLFPGLLKKEKEKHFGLWIAFLLSALLYLFVIARGNVQHDYYQILILPVISVFLGRGAIYLLSIREGINRGIALFSFLLITLFTFAFSWYQVRDYFNINNTAMVEAGRKADEVLPENAKVIAPYDGDTTFLYHINRQGWPVFQKSIEELIDMGATHLVIASPTENDFAGFGTQYEILTSSDAFLILRLQ